MQKIFDNYTLVIVTAGFVMLTIVLGIGAEKLELKEKQLIECQENNNKTTK